jgi:quinol monooxygenase YgiN
MQANSSDSVTTAQSTSSLKTDAKYVLIRIVRMHFTEAGVEEFLDIFDRHKEAIRNFPGCTHLQLLKDADDPLCYITLSNWDNPADLEKYRKSELFGSVWGRVKTLFSERSQAFSLERFIEV